MTASSRTARLLRAVLAVSTLAAVTLVVPTRADAAAPAAIDLGAAAPFAILAGASVGNTVTGDVTVVRGDLGVLAPTGLVTGFPPGLVRGTLHASGAAAVVAAHASLVSAYAEAAGRATDFPLAADLIGLTLHPGVHTNAAAVGNTGTVTLNGDGNPNAVFIFQVGGALTTAASSKVILTNSAQAKNVFWQVDGAGAIGAGSSFAGTLMTAAAIGVGAGTTFNGRALARTGAIATDSNQFYSAPPVVTLDGGATAITTTDTPVLTGHTSVDLPASITVTIGSQPLTTTVQSNGTWTVTAAPMSNGAYTVNATVVDAVGNIGSDSQMLTVDTVPPVIGFDDGPTRLTNDATPTIVGSSDVPSMSVVTLTVAGQTRTTLVQTDGSWNITPTTVADGTWTVTASVVDEAGNPASETQSLVVDTVAPSVTIIGGANALTNDPSPTISGSSSDSGASLTLSVSGVVTSSSVHGDGTWSENAAALSDGVHPIVVSVTDAAGNTRSATQSLTIDTVAPGISIAGGGSVSTDDQTPTIAGATPAAVASVVTVTVAGQTRTALVQPDGTWNVTPTTLSYGTHVAVASVADPAGNISTATQTIAVTFSATSPTTTGPPTTTAPPTTQPITPTQPVAVVTVGPKRVFDTRIGFSPGVLRSVPMAQIGRTLELAVQLTDLPGYVPANGVGAVSLNVTVTNPEAAGFLTVYACGVREAVSSVNFSIAQTVANAVITPVSSTGTVCFYASSLADIIVDINGWLPSGQAFTPIGPKRLFDTRVGANDQLLGSVANVPIPSDGMIEVNVTDLAGFVPASGVDSVSLNVTVTNPAADGFITVYACGTRAAVSSVNYVAGQTVANSVIAPISPRGTICFYSQSKTDLVVDINGWFKTSAGFVGFSPQRLLDTRVTEPDALRVVPKSKLGGDYILQVHATGLDGLVPAAGVAAVSLNVTVTDPSEAGFVTVYACGVREQVSSVNYSQRQTIANAVIAPVSTVGTICFFAHGFTELIVDINGWFASAS
ncbi:MAG: ice-binding family protein [Acidimicrobiales bacterium]